MIKFQKKQISHKSQIFNPFKRKSTSSHFTVEITSFKLTNAAHTSHEQPDFSQRFLENHTQRPEGGNKEVFTSVQKEKEPVPTGRRKKGVNLKTKKALSRQVRSRNRGHENNDDTLLAADETNFCGGKGAGKRPRNEIFPIGGNFKNDVSVLKNFHGNSIESRLSCRSTFRMCL